MATQDLGFNVFALDRASKTFIRLAERIERVSDKLDELDRKRANPKIDLDVDESKVRRAVNTFADAADNEAERRRGGFFRTMFTPNRGIVMALRTGIPAVLGSPIGAAALALGGLFAASFAAAVLSSGVFALIAGGFTAIAAVALKNNARVAASFAALGATVKSQLSQAATVLVPAFEDAMSTVQAMFGPHIREPLERIFAGLGPTIVPFVESAVQTVGNILSSLATPRFLTGMQTVLASIANELPRFGDAIGGFFLKLADNADDTAEAFSNVITVTNGLIGLLSELTVVLTDTFNRFSDIGNLLADVTDPTTELAQALGLAKEETGALEFAGGQLLSIFDMFTLNLRNVIPEMLGWKDSTEEGGKAAGRAGESMQKLAGSSMLASEQAQILADRQQKLRDRLDATNDALGEEEQKLEDLKSSLFTTAEGTLSLRDAQREYEEQLDTTRETLKENGETLDRNTEKGRENEDSIDAIAEAAHRQIQAMIEQGKSTDQVSKFTRQARKDFLNAADAAGMEEGAAKRLANQLGLVPSEVETKLEAIDNASAEIQRLKERIAAIERQINIRVRITQTRVEAGGAFGGGAFAHDGGMITTTGIRRFHSGGVLRPDERIIIGQTGERVLNRRETAAYNAGMAIGGGGAGMASFTVVNHGVIGSQRETEDWLTRSLDNLKRKGRLPV